MGVPTAGKPHAHAVPAPPPARATATPVVGPGVPRAPPAQVPPAVPYGGMQHVSHGPARHPHPDAPKWTPPVATGGVPPAGPTPTLPPTLPAEAHRAWQAPLAPTPQAELVEAWYAEAKQSQPAVLTRERAAATPRATPARHVALGEALPQPAAQVPPSKRTGAPPAPAVPGAPVTGGLAPAYGATPAPVECRGAPPMEGLPTAVQVAPVAQGATVAGPPDISELLAQALETYRREAAGGAQAEPAAMGTHSDVGELIAQALATSRQQGVVSTPDVATLAREAVEERVELRQPRDVDAGSTSAEQSVERMQEGAMDHGDVAPCGGRTEVEGVEEWMWEWREWRKVAPRELCPAGLLFRMDLATGTNHARLPDSLRARLDAAEGARGGDADEQPLAPFRPQPESPQAVVAEGKGERAQDVAVENVEEEEEYGPGESALVLMYEDDAEPDVYVGMDVDTAIAALLPMPTEVPPPPLGSCEQRHCSFHATEDVH